MLGERETIIDILITGKCNVKKNVTGQQRLGVEMSLLQLDRKCRKGQSEKLKFGKDLEEGNGNPFQYSFLENCINRGA